MCFADYQKRLDIASETDRKTNLEMEKMKIVLADRVHIINSLHEVSKNFH